MMSAALDQIAAYPIKGLEGRKLKSTVLIKDHGVERDRKFALTVVPEVDGSVWKSPRSFLINAINDDLLKIKWETAQKFELPTFKAR